MRPGWDCPNIFHPRQDKFQNCVHDQYATESLSTFSLKTDTLVLHWKNVLLDHWYVQYYEPVVEYIGKAVNEYVDLTVPYSEETNQTW